MTDSNGRTSICNAGGGDQNHKRKAFPALPGFKAEGRKGSCTTPVANKYPGLTECRMLIIHAAVRIAPINYFYKFNPCHPRTVGGHADFCRIALIKLKT